jgi:general secretion pathway protein G
MVIRHRNALRSARLGFTLMEILVVVAIIVILAGLGGYYFIGALQGSQKDAAILRAKEVSKAIGVYYVDHQQWPASLDALLVRDQNGKGPYLKSRDYLLDPWGNLFQYDPSGQMNNGLEPDVFCISPDQQKIGNWTQKR